MAPRNDDPHAPVANLPDASPAAASPGALAPPHPSPAGSVPPPFAGVSAATVTIEHKTATETATDGPLAPALQPVAAFDPFAARAGSAAVATADFEEEEDYPGIKKRKHSIRPSTEPHQAVVEYREKAEAAIEQAVELQMLLDELKAELTSAREESMGLRGEVEALQAELLEQASNAKKIRQLEDTNAPTPGFVARAMQSTGLAVPIASFAPVAENAVAPVITTNGLAANGVTPAANLHNTIAPAATAAAVTAQVEEHEEEEEAKEEEEKVRDMAPAEIQRIKLLSKKHGCRLTPAGNDTPAFGTGLNGGGQANGDGGRAVGQEKQGKRKRQEKASKSRVTSALSKKHIAGQGSMLGFVKKIDKASAPGANEDSVRAATAAAPIAERHPLLSHAQAPPPNVLDSPDTALAPAHVPAPAAPASGRVMINSMEWKHWLFEPPSSY